jgi:hypothetical protein
MITGARNTESGAESRESLAPARELLPGGIIVVRTLDQTLPQQERDYEVNIYPDGTVGCQTLLVQKPGGAAAAAEIAKAQPWVRALLYPCSSYSLQRTGGTGPEP